MVCVYICMFLFYIFVFNAIGVAQRENKVGKLILF